MSLHEEITKDPLGIGYAAMTPQEIEQSLNAMTRTKLVATEIGNGTILEAIGLASGNALLDVLYTQPDFRHVKPLLEQGRLRLDSALVQLSIDGLATMNVITEAEADKLKALAVVPCSRAEELGIVNNDIEVRAALGV
jgi:hypothetical protein